MGTISIIHRKDPYFKETGFNGTRKGPTVFFWQNIMRLKHFMKTTTRQLLLESCGILGCFFPWKELMGEIGETQQIVILEPVFSFLKRTGKMKMMFWNDPSV